MEVFFFFSSRRRHTRWPRDWSSDVCSSDLGPFWAQISPQVARNLLPFVRARRSSATHIGFQAHSPTLTVVFPCFTRLQSEHGTQKEGDPCSRDSPFPAVSRTPKSAGS